MLGRLDDVVVSGGVNVPPPAVAARLRDAPGGAGRRGARRPDAEWGQRVVAFVVGELALERGARLGGRGAPALVGAARSWSSLDALPLLANGKVGPAAPLPRHGCGR